MKVERKILVKTQEGPFVLEFSAKGLYRVRFPLHPPTLKPGIRVGAGPIKRLLGRRHRRLDLAGCTPFHRKVYAALRKVPAGSVISYRELACRAGHPGAARAVGTAMRRNRLPIVIPCHRVVPATGGLGNYSAGVKWKRWLLEYEGRQARRSQSYKKTTG